MIEREIFRRHPVSWFETHGRIQGKTVGIGAHIPPRLNWLQREIGRAVGWCLAHRQPVRLIVCKPRQKGCSTITVELAYVWSRLVPINGLIIGGQKSQCDNLWKTLRRYQRHDTFRGWGNKMTTDSQKAACDNGSLIEKETAGDKDAGRSGTYHFLIVTELARWPSDGAKNAAEVLNSVLCCVPKEPDTFVIMESTANGPVGVFAETWQGAVTLEQRQAGEIGNGYIRIFAPWYAFEDSRRALPGAEAATLRARLKAAKDEKALLVWDKYQLEPEQIAYYHELLVAPECSGDPVKRDKEYPTTPEDGFAASSPSRFSSEGLNLLEAQALEAERRGEIEYCTLEFPKRPPTAFNPFDPASTLRPAPLPCPPTEAELMIVERPRPGLSYLVSVDNATGATHVSGSDSDWNAVVVLRDGYVHSSGRWMPPEPVASITPKNRWDADILADFVAKLALYYGHCLVVPEANRGEWLIKELLQRNAWVMERKRPATDVEAHKPSGKWGWMTTESTKKALTDELARHLRQPEAEGAGLACRFTHILTQCRTFVHHPDGTLGALRVTGCHDDFVMALGIALTCRSMATPYSIAAQPRLVDMEFERMRAAGGTAAGRGAW